MDLGSIEAMRTSPCIMCRTLADMAPITPQDSEWWTRRFIDMSSYQLRAFKAAWVYTGLCDRFPGVVLGVSPKSISTLSGTQTVIRAILEETGYLSLANSPLGDNKTSSFEVRRLQPQAFDAELVKEWLTCCDSSHGPRCSIDGMPRLFQFKVFDCRTRRVVIAPKGCRYVALSYVWGATGSGPTRHGAALNEHVRHGTLDKVIEDSITVTLTLGLEYLWVDRICIGQAHGEDEKLQIRQMGQIYAQAALTIIAAAGNDPSCGLPGVNGKQRALQKTLVLGGKTLVSSLPTGGYAIRNSTWNTRGWTYQEGMLSRRRLTFTDHQVVFDCNSMHCTEAVKLPLDLIHTKDGRFDDFALDMGSFHYKAPGSKPLDFMLYVSEYSTRRLTYPEDTINAIEGVLQSFRHAESPVYHFWGMPLFTDDAQMWPDGDGGDVSRTLSSRFVISLFWHLGGDASTYERVVDSEVCFPSWSWAAWEDRTVGYTVPPSISVESFTDVQVWLEDGGGALSNLDNVDLSSRLHDTYTSVLNIKGWTLPVSLVDLKFTSEDMSAFLSPRENIETTELPDGTPENGYHVGFEVGDRTLYVRLDRQVRLESYLSGDYSFMLLLPYSFKETEDRGLWDTVMLLASTGLHYERLDLFWFHSWWAWNENGELEGSVTDSVAQWEKLGSIKQVFRLG